MLSFIQKHAAPFYDLRAWTLIALCAGGVFLFDPVMARTLLEWTLIFGVFAGVAVIISRHVFPQISLTDVVSTASGSPNGAGMIALGVLIFMSFLVLALTIWGKA